MMSSWTDLDWKSLIVGAVIGLAPSAVLGAWFVYYIESPVLTVNGGGGGGGPGPGFYERHIRVSNERGFMGIRIPETTIFGFQVHNDIEMGEVYDRSPAYDCRAYLFDKETKQRIALWWRQNDRSFARKVTLQSGASASLMLFARRYSEPVRYFVFQPKNETGNEIDVPPQHATFDDTRHFFVEVRCLNNKKKLETDVSVIRGLNGRLSFRGAVGGGSF